MLKETPIQPAPKFEAAQPNRGNPTEGRPYEGTISFSLKSNQFCLTCTTTSQCNGEIHPEPIM